MRGLGNISQPPQGIYLVIELAQHLDFHLLRKGSVITETVVSEGYCLLANKWDHFYASTGSHRM